jgi:hypothetical protein
MGEYSAKPKPASDVILRRRPGDVAAFRRGRRNAEARSIPDRGRIVLRSGSTTLR